MDGVLQKRTLETHAMLLTIITPIHLIIIKEIEALWKKHRMAVGADFYKLVFSKLLGAITGGLAEG